MTTLQDAKLSALETLTGTTGHVNDLEQAYLLQLITGAPISSTIDGLWDQVFTEAAIPAGQFNDRWFTYMDSILAPATAGAYNDRSQEYWEGGGTPLGPVAPSPPAQANLLHWFDLTDAPTVFQDVGGTVLATDGSNVRNITNKGTDGQALIDAGTVPKYAVDLVNGLNALSDQAASLIGSTMVNGTAVAGFTFATVARRTDQLFGAAAFVGWNFVTNLNHASLTATGWRTRVPGDAFFNTGRADTTFEWVWNYGAIDAAGNRTIQTSGEAVIGGAGTYTPIPGGEVLQLLGGNGEIAELLIWDRALTAPELAALVAYFDAKFGVMPFVGLPPVAAALIHHFDFTDPTTVFKNPPATQPALDGDFIRQVTNKGTDGTPITSSTDGVSPIYRTGVVNGLNIADYNGVSKELLAVIAAAHASSTKGLSMALVFRWISGAAATNPMAAWGGNLGRTSALRNGNWFVAGLPGNIFSLAPLGPSTWYLGAFAFDGGAGLDRFQWSGEALQTNAFGALTDILAGSTLEIKNAATEIQVAEYAVWDGQLTASEFTDLFAFADNKYGTLPIAPAPPSLGTLQHWFDFSDPATMFTDVAGTVPVAVSGDLIRHIANKGTDGTPLIQAGSAMTFEPGVVNTHSVGRWLTTEDINATIAAAGGAAWTMAGVTRRNSGDPVAGTEAFFDWGASNMRFVGQVGTAFHTSFGTFTTGVAAASTEWVGMYFGGDVVDSFARQSGAAEIVTGATSGATVGAGSLMRVGEVIGAFPGENAEMLVYSSKLSVADRAALFAYFDAKYGTLPHL